MKSIYKGKNPGSRQIRRVPISSWYMAQHRNEKKKNPGVKNVLKLYTYHHIII